MAPTRESLECEDRAARVRALDTSRSFIVQAPAGAGKTTLLIQRYLALLACVAAPEEVVAITFTRKAAGEMLERISSALEAAREGRAPDSQNDGTMLELAAVAVRADVEHGWGLAENPGRLRIQTIDALCLALAAQMPLLSRLGSVPTPRDDAEKLYLEAARETLALLEDPKWSDRIAELLRHVDNDTQEAERLLAGLLRRRDQWMRHHWRLDRAELTGALANLVREGLEHLRACWPRDLEGELLFCARFAQANLSAIEGASSALRAANLASLPSVEPDQLGVWQALVRLLLTQEGEVRKGVTRLDGFPAPSERDLHAGQRRERGQAKARMERLLEEVAQLPELVSALVQVRRLPSPVYSDEQWRFLEALSALLPLAVAQLALIFRTRGEVDFTETLLAANRALGEPDAPTDLALAVDYRIRHLLVDEFQDTSLSQFELLRRLTAGWQPGDGRTLFAVGDPMQSIYRFREAEVGLFLRARHEGLGSVELEPLTLAVNFRSQRAIVAWVNRVFARALPEREDLVSGAVPFAASVADQPALDGDAVCVHAASDRASEARIVVELVRSARAEASHQSVAILVRSRAHLNHIVPALAQAGLRFRAIEIEELAHRPAIQDLHALTRALLHPADRAAWLSVLRAPWCGLSLLDLEDLVGEARTGVVWTRMTDADVTRGLSAEGRLRLARVVEALAPALEHRGRGGLRRRIEAAWMRLGGPASVQEPTDLDDALAYLDLIESLERGGDLEDLAALDVELAKLYALPDVGAPDTLQVMTIHKAKGLAFDTVIIPGLGRGPRGDDPELLRWIERPRGEETDLLIASIGARGGTPDPIYACVTRLQEARQQHEDGRLLYVAATRARKRLHLVAQIRIERGPAGEPAPTRPGKHTLLAKLWPAVAGEFARALSAQGEPAASAPARADPLTYPLRRLAPQWSAPPPPATVQWRPIEPRAEERDTAVEFSWAGETARHVGTVVHLLLQRMAVEGLEAWSVARIDRVEELLRLVLKQQGVAGGELESAHTRVRQALVSVLEDPRARWLLSAEHDEARSEHRITGELDGALVNVALDRTFVDREGVRWIVDYKTGVHQGGDLDAFLDRERERYRDQLERYATLIARTESRPIRVGLYFPLLRGWREWSASAGGKPGE